MIFKRTKIYILSFLLISNLSVVFAQLSQKVHSVNIAVTEDTYIENGNFSKKNYNQSTILKEKSWIFRQGLKSEVRLESKTLLKFDLSRIPNNCKIKSATLTVYSNSFYNKNTPSSSVQILKINQNWNTNNVTWDNFNHQNTIISEVNFPLSNEVIALNFDLTNQVNSIVSGNSQNFGWLISSVIKSARNENFTFEHQFFSKEYKKGLYQAQLNIEYVIEPKLDYRSLYVNDFYLILGDENQENALVEYAQCMEFNQLYLRKMRNCQLWHDENRVKLRNFIRKAKKSGIKSVGVFTESANSIYNNKIDLFNQEATDELEFIDAFHLDFHYWHATHPQEYYCKQYLSKNNFSCDNRGAFNFFLTQLDLFQEIKSGYKYPVEVSLALEKVDDYEAEVLQKYFAAGYINNIHFTIYRKPNSQNEINLFNFNSQKERLKILNNDYQGIEVVPVFLTHDKAGLHLGEWLQKSGTIKDAENNYLEGFKNEENPEINNNIILQKAAWSRYTDMPSCLKDNKNWITPQKLNAYSSLKIVEEKAIQIYNTQNEIFVNFKSDENEEFTSGNIQLYSIDGKLIYQDILPNYENNFDIKVTKGIYIIKVSQGKFQETQKVVLGE